MSTRKLKTSPLWALALIAALGLGMSACVHDGGGDDPATDETETPPEPEPTAYEAGLAAINAATTAAAAQAAHDAVDATMITAAEAQSLQMALNDRLLELNPPQPVAVTMPDEIPEGYAPAADVYHIAAGTSAVTGILENSADDGGVSFYCDAGGPDCVVTVDADGTVTASPDSGMVYVQLWGNALAIVQEAAALAARQEEQRRFLLHASGMLDTSDVTTADDIVEANEAIALLQAALAAAVDLSAEEKAPYQTQLDNARTDVSTAQDALNTQERMMVQRDRITNAVTAARAAVGRVNDDSTEDEVSAADSAIAELEAAIDGAADLDAADPDVASARGTLTTLKGTLMLAKDSRDAALEDERLMDAAANAATAAKLYAGIGAPTADATAAAARRHAAYNADGDIVVSIGLAPDADPNPGSVTTLAEDEDATVGMLHGWEGMKFTAEPTGDAGTYEAVVYSNIGEPTPGAKFSAEYPNTETFVDNGVLTINTSGTDTPESRVASPRFDQSAGVKAFMLPNEDTTAVRIPGSYHGVSGEYRCVPGAATSACAASLTGEGFELGTVTIDADGNVVAPITFTDGGGTWTFTPSNAEARVMQLEDMTYASYGWWLHTSEDGNTLTASAFHTFKGTASAVAIGDLVAGAAKYVGGAAGKYALASSTGGTNDAGHFTARATLEADFEDDTITGTIDSFMGADGKARNWSVELKESALFNDGSIIGDPDRAGIDLTGAPSGTDDVAQDTVWTIAETAADESGQWSGNLREEGTDGVPQVATGTFYSEYGTSGRMVGAFGANREE